MAVGSCTTHHCSKLPYSPPGESCSCGKFLSRSTQSVALIQKRLQANKGDCASCSGYVADSEAASQPGYLTRKKRHLKKTQSQFLSHLNRKSKHPSDSPTVIYPKKIDNQPAQDESGFITDQVYFHSSLAGSGDFLKTTHQTPEPGSGLPAGDGRLYHRDIHIPTCTGSANRKQKNGEHPLSTPHFSPSVSARSSPTLFETATGGTPTEYHAFDKSGQPFHSLSDSAQPRSIALGSNALNRDDTLNRHLTQASSQTSTDKLFKSSTTSSGHTSKADIATVAGKKVLPPIAFNSQLSQGEILKHYTIHQPSAVIQLMIKHICQRTENQSQLETCFPALMALQYEPTLHSPEHLQTLLEQLSKCPHLPDFKRHIEQEICLVHGKHLLIELNAFQPETAHKSELLSAREKFCLLEFIQDKLKYKVNAWITTFCPFITQLEQGIREIERKKIRLSTRLIHCWLVEESNGLPNARWFKLHLPTQEYIENSINNNTHGDKAFFIAILAYIDAIDAMKTCQAHHYHENSKIITYSEKFLAQVAGKLPTDILPPVDLDTSATRAKHIDQSVSLLTGIIRHYLINHFDPLITRMRTIYDQYEKVQQNNDDHEAWSRLRLEWKRLTAILITSTILTTLVARFIWVTGIVVLFSNPLLTTLLASALLFSCCFNYLARWQNQFDAIKRPLSEAIDEYNARVFAENNPGIDNARQQIHKQCKDILERISENNESQALMNHEFAVALANHWDQYPSKEDHAEIILQSLNELEPRIQNDTNHVHLYMQDIEQLKDALRDTSPLVSDEQAIIQFNQRMQLKCFALKPAEGSESEIVYQLTFRIILAELLLYAACGTKNPGTDCSAIRCTLEEYYIRGLKGELIRNRLILERELQSFKQEPENLSTQESGLMEISLDEEKSRIQTQKIQWLQEDMEDLIKKAWKQVFMNHFRDQPEVSQQDLTAAVNDQSLIQKFIIELRKVQVAGLQ